MSTTQPSGSGGPVTPTDPVTQRCICGPDITGEDIDVRPDCPAHDDPGHPDDEVPF